MPSVGGGGAPGGIGGDAAHGESEYMYRHLYGRNIDPLGISTASRICLEDEQAGTRAAKQIASNGEVHIPPDLCVCLTNQKMRCRWANQIETVPGSKFDAGGSRLHVPASWCSGIDGSEQGWLADGDRRSVLSGAQRFVAHTLCCPPGLSALLFRFPLAVELCVLADDGILDWNGGGCVGAQYVKQRTRHVLQSSESVGLGQCRRGANESCHHLTRPWRQMDRGQVAKIGENSSTGEVRGAHHHACTEYSGSLTLARFSCPRT